MNQSLVPAAQAQHVGRDPADLRIVDRDVPGDRVAVVRAGQPGSQLGTWLQKISQALSPGEPLHMILYAGLIIGFRVLLHALVFNSQETADNLKKSGALIPGIRPGKATADYIDGVLTRLTGPAASTWCWSACCPRSCAASSRASFYFGGTSLLIVVVVVMDFIARSRPT